MQDCRSRPSYRSSMVSCSMRRNLKERNADIKLILSLRGCTSHSAQLWSVIEVESQTDGATSSGINRLTRNMQFGLPLISDAFRYASTPSCSCMPHLTKLQSSSISDAEAVAMSRYLVQNDGLFLGSSSACNLVACIKLAKKMGWKDGQRIVTIL